MAVDVNILMAYVLTLLSFVLCVVYGILNWNKGGEVSEEEAREEETWDKEEKLIEDELGGTP